MDTESETGQLTQRWLELDNTIRRSNEMVREIRDERNSVAQSLILLLHEQGYTKPSLRLGGETILLTEPLRRPPITPATIRVAMDGVGVEAGTQQLVLDRLEQNRASAATTTQAIERKRSRRGKGRRTRRAAEKSP